MGAEKAPLVHRFPVLKRLEFRKASSGNPAELLVASFFFEKLLWPTKHMIIIMPVRRLCDPRRPSDSGAAEEHRLNLRGKPILPSQQ